MSALHVSGDVFAHHQEHLTVFTVSFSAHPSCCRLVQSSAPDDGRKHHPKHVQPTWNNKLFCIVHLVGYFHRCITMNGFMNVKFTGTTYYLFVINKIPSQSVTFV